MFALQLQTGATFAAFIACQNMGSTGFHVQN